MTSIKLRHDTAAEQVINMHLLYFGPARREHDGRTSHVLFWRRCSDISADKVEGSSNAIRRRVTPTRPLLQSAAALKAWTAPNPAARVAYRFFFSFSRLRAAASFDRSSARRRSNVLRFCSSVSDVNSFLKCSMLAFAICTSIETIGCLCTNCPHL
ncbi:hypothetical protein [Bradyrhizobium liaoningense]